MSATAHYVSAHWHLGITQNGQDILRKDPTDRSSIYSDFHKRLAANLVAMQQLFPALFVRPDVAERDDTQRYDKNGFYNEDAEDYNGPQRLAYNGTDSRVSVRRGNITEPIMTV